MTTLAFAAKSASLVSLCLLAAGLAIEQNVSKTGSDLPATEEKPATDAAGGLQKAVQNPVASLISVPVQNNSNFGIGPFDRNQNVLNIRPVIPIGISDNWNMIIRWITPVIWQSPPGTTNLEVYDIEEDSPAYFVAKVCKRRREYLASEI